MEDNWCWEQSFIDVDVGAEDLKGVLFVQKCYWVNIISAHDVDSYMTQPDGSNLNLKIQPIYLKGEKYLLKGQINVNMIVDIQNGGGSVIDAANAILSSDGKDQTITAIL